MQVEMCAYWHEERGGLFRVFSHSPEQALMQSNTNDFTPLSIGRPILVSGKVE